jgi:hypothetical protein
MELSDGTIDVVGTLPSRTGGDFGVSHETIRTVLKRSAA